MPKLKRKVAFPCLAPPFSHPLLAHPWMFALSQALIRFRPVEIPLFINFPSRKAKAARSRLVVSVVCVISTTEMRIITKIKARFIHAYTVIFTDDPLENFFFFFFENFIYWYHLEFYLFFFRNEWINNEQFE